MMCTTLEQFLNKNDLTINNIFVNFIIILKNFYFTFSDILNEKLIISE